MSSNPPNDGSGPPSRLTRQLDLLGIEKGRGIAPEKLAHDRRLMDAVGDLPPLAFGSGKQTVPSRRTPQRWVQASVLLAAAVTLIVWMRRNDEDGLRMKGDIGTARAFADVGGEIRPVAPDTPLPDGAKVRVEVTAHADAVAYLGIVSRSGTLLTSVDDAQAASLVLGAGTKAAFPGALELVGANEGETAVVVLCAKGALDGVAGAALRADLSETLASRQGRGVLARCKTEAIRLR